MSEEIVSAYGNPEEYKKAVFGQVDRINSAIAEYRKRESHIDDVIRTVEALGSMLSPYFDEYYYEEIKKMKQEIDYIKAEVSPQDEEAEYMRLVFNKMDIYYRIMFTQNMTIAKLKIPIILPKGSKSYEKYMARKRKFGKPDSPDDTEETDEE